MKIIYYKNVMLYSSPNVSHNLVLVFCMATHVPTVTTHRVPAVKLCLAAVASCDCWVCHSVSSLLCCHYGKKAHWCMGRVSCMGWPYSFWAGESPSLTDGVLRYCMRAWYSTDLFKNYAIYAVLSTFFITFTVTSAFPLPRG